MSNDTPAAADPLRGDPRDPKVRDLLALIGAHLPAAPQGGES